MIWFLLFFFLLKDVSPSQEDRMSPFNQYLPNCNEDFTRIRKKTEAKALLCPMIR